MKQTTKINRQVQNQHNKIFDLSFLYMMKINKINKELGERIKKRRKIMNMSQKQLGKAIGVSYQQIQKYEKGENGLSVERLFSISEALQTDIGNLLAIPDLKHYMDIIWC